MQYKYFDRRYSNKYFHLFLAILISFNVLSSEKHALIIAVGQYPKDSGWNSINSANDMALIEKTLSHQNFKKANITLIQDRKATYKGIKNALKVLTQKLDIGDIVVIHFSGHGQPIFDDNGDEIDGYDESWVPYDAKAVYGLNGYYGENHLRDDELGDLITEIRNKLGSYGQLLLISDSCHSGTATRGLIGEVHRGGFSAFEPKDYNPNQIKNDDINLIDRLEISRNAAPFVAFSGSKAAQLNFEYQGYGSLTYAFSEAISNQSSTKQTYRQLFAKILSKMSKIAPRQQPYVEGDLDLMLFNNEFVLQDNYFNVSEFKSANEIKIQGGRLQQIFTDGTLFLCQAGTLSPDDSNVLAKGRVINSNVNEAVIKLNKELDDRNPNNYWVFIDKIGYPKLDLNVYFHPNVTNKQVKDSIVNFLRYEGLGQTTTDTLKADLAIFEESGRYKLVKPGKSDSFSFSKSLNLEGLKQKIVSYKKSKYIKLIDFKNDSYKFKFELLPVKTSAENKGIDEFLDKKDFLNNEGVFQVKANKDRVIVKVSNLGKEPIYFSIVEINSIGEIVPFIPNSTHDYADSERYILPGKSFVFKEQLFSFDPPYERLILKGFASNQPIDLRVGDTRSLKSTKNYVENLFNKSYEANDGTLDNDQEEINGYSYEFIYDIVKD